MLQVQPLRYFPDFDGFFARDPWNGLRIIFPQRATWREPAEAAGAARYPF